MQNDTPSIWAIATLFVVAPIFLVIWFRLMTAKTSKDHAVNFALVMGACLVTSVLISFSGLGPSPEQIREAQKFAPGLEVAMQSNTWEVFVASAIWFFGGNYIVLRQRRKAGESWGQALNPFAPPMRYMDGRSWLQTLLLAFVSLALALIGLARLM